MSDEYFKASSDYKPNERSLALAKAEEKRAMEALTDDHVEFRTEHGDDDHEWLEARHGVKDE